MRKTGTFKAFLLLLTLALLCLVAGCGEREPALEFYSLERQDYTSDNGYTIQFPADWVMLAENQESVTFASSAGDLSCTVSCELGGVEYYSLEETGDMLMETMAARLFSEWEAQDAQVSGATYRRLVHGTAQDQQDLTADINLYHFQDGVRYYMTFVSETDDYEAQKPLINGIIGSFQTTLDQDEIYMLMMERREEQEAQEKAKPQLQDAPAEEEGPEKTEE